MGRGVADDRLVGTVDIKLLSLIHANRNRSGLHCSDEFFSLDRDLP